MVVSAVSGVLAVKLFFDDDGSLRGVNILMLLIPSRDHLGVPNAIRYENFIGKYQENWISDSGSKKMRDQHLFPI